ncbi:trypsin-like cysteine/serine peptidase domain-containing protein [Daldinia caldariorum]|uniref:trypsin-like cysteine/serine peptidase domain-containing protein n=1 Tax=Daldinia caldariorum TaxID=326644 RepID=UPI00200847D7|nr:trypsin-like cysteine/serine peptidase domain-containing protein [Daldinia caldariorum]KAI1472812.1 trypsin-like cysteine/serine peptidase domain-containing protein [Daldinia caldariorum]
MGNIKSRLVLEFTSDGELDIDALAKKRLAISQQESSRERRARIECLPTLIDGGPSAAVAFWYPSDHPFDYGEASIGLNRREVISDTYVQNDGPWSGIVRVEALFLGRTGKWWRTTGSAVIFDDYHVMTVGHNVWSREGGLALFVSIHRDRRADPEHLDTRYVDAGAVHYQWAKACSEAKESKFMGKAAWENDFAILRVSKPFHEGCRRMEYGKTPLGDTNVGIYGFPRDMSIDNKVWQASLCFSRSTVTYAPTTSTMLDHDGDTAGGNSGGPVVDNASGKVIALHRGYDKVKLHRRAEVDLAEINKAVALLVKGNDPEKFSQAIDVLTGEESVEYLRVRKGPRFSIGECTAALVFDCD